MKHRWDDPGLRLLFAAFLLAVAACFPWRTERDHTMYRHIAVVDITRSMNVADYRLGETPVSRLEFTKASLKGALRELPCGSELGLAVFTERRSTLLFEPIEVCEGYGVLDAALERLDWRMAWEADSRIADGVNNTLELLAPYGANVVFFTDGHEAPPANPRYRPDLSRWKGRLHGVLVGVGGLTPSPIPKFDSQGRLAGFVEADEVPHASRFGLPEKAPEQIEGYHARNAPFGSASAVGSEHLSALRESYLRELAGETGFAYRRLERVADVSDTWTAQEFATRRRIATDLRPWPASLALAALTWLYAGAGIRLRWLRLRSGTP